MTDQTDHTQAALDHARDAAIARHRTMMAQDAQTPSAMVCATCGDRIPDLRRRAVPGTQHCVHCAAHITRGPR